MYQVPITWERQVQKEGRLLASPTTHSALIYQAPPRGLTLQMTLNGRFGLQVMTPRPGGTAFTPWAMLPQVNKG